jgi:para-aminobenzoate synthetase/4-amino-4-deoxychorismate lyase
MLDSADYFDIPLTKQNLEDYLDQISSGLRSPQRVRVLLDQYGKLCSEFIPFHRLDDKRPLKVRLAKESVHSRNVFLFHKTTQRDVYETARKGFEDLDDVLLYNEKAELTEFTIGNLVVELDGQLFTPPLICGVLAGTFRAHLLETGQAMEKVIQIEQLTHCTKIFRVNSIRCWQTAELIV